MRCLDFVFQALHVQEHQASQEQRLLRELEELKDDLAPLEEQKSIMSAQAEKRTNHLTWLGLGAMSVQFGILARLTWWEYSWDIMEPGTSRHSLICINMNGVYYNQPVY